MNANPECYADLGSSPRVRGTLLGWVECVDNVRFIPARAGNTLR